MTIQCISGDYPVDSYILLISRGARQFHISSYTMMKNLDNIAVPIIYCALLNEEAHDYQG